MNMHMDRQPERHYQTNKMGRKTHRQTQSHKYTCRQRRQIHRQTGRQTISISYFHSCMSVLYIIYVCLPVLFICWCVCLSSLFVCLPASSLCFYICLIIHYDYIFFTSISYLYSCLPFPYKSYTYLPVLFMYLYVCI